MRRGLSSVQVLVAAVVLATAVLALVSTLRPKKLMTAMEREVRSDLAKIVTALNVYLEEHDGGLPCALVATTRD